MIYDKISHPRKRMKLSMHRNGNDKNEGTDLWFILHADVHPTPGLPTSLLAIYVQAYSKSRRQPPTPRRRLADGWARWADGGCQRGALRGLTLSEL